MDNIDLFNNDQTLVVQDIETTDTGEYITDDFIFEKDLEQRELAKLPDYLKNKKSTRDAIQKHIQNILAIKNQGLKKLSEVDNKIVNDYLQFNFNQNWIIPVTKNKKKIYYIETEDENFDTFKRERNKYLKDNEEDTYVEINQVKNLEDASALYNRYKDDELEIDTFTKKINDYFNPYTPSPSKIEVKKIRHTTKVLREANIDNLHWLEYRSLAREEFNYIHIDDNDVISDRQKTLAEPDTIQLSGFFIIHPKYSSISEALAKNNPIVYKLEYLGNATKIKYNSTNERVEVSLLKDNNINDGDCILIRDANSFPSDAINRKCQNSVKKTKDGFSFQSTTPLKKEGTYADIYRITKLNYDKVSEPTEIDYSKTRTNKLAEEPIYYQFDRKTQEHLTNDKFKSVLKALIPPLDKLLNFFPQKVDEFLYGHDFESLFNSFNQLTYNNMPANAVVELQKTINKNIENSKKNEKKKDTEFEKDTKEIIKEREKYVREIFDDDIISYLDDKNFTNPELEKYYGKYLLFNTIYDSPLARITWILNHPDNGDYFFSTYILNTLKEPNISKKTTNAEIKGLEILIEKNEKKLEEMKKQKDFFNMNIDIVVFCLEELEKYKSKPVGTYALLKQNILDSSIYQLEEKKEGNQKVKVWKLKTKTTYDSIRDICNFKNIPFENIKEGDLDNFFTLVLKCKTRSYVRLYNKVQKNKEKLEIQKEQIKDIIGGNFYKSIQQTVDKAKQKLYRFVMLSNKQDGDGDTVDGNNIIDDENVEETKREDVFEDLPILKKINSLSNVEQKKELIYQYIDKDGFLIGDYIYSKSIKKPVLCGHYQYLKYIYDVDGLENKTKIQNLLLDNFGYEDRTKSGAIYCRVCGDYLSNIKFSQDLGFSREGKLIVATEILTDEEVSQEKKRLEKALRERERTLDCNKIRRELISAGISLDKIPLGEKNCRTLINIMNKSGFVLNYNDIIRTIISSISHTETKQSLNRFKKNFYYSLKKSGKTSRQIKKILENQEFIKLQYQKYSTKYDTVQNIKLMAEFAVSLKTTFPKYKKAKTSLRCAFEGYDKLFEFLSCLLNELKLVYEFNVKSRELRILQEDKIIGLLKQEVNRLRRIPEIKQLFFDVYQKEKELMYLAKEEIKGNSGGLSGAYDSHVFTELFYKDYANVELPDKEQLPADFEDIVKSDRYESNMKKQLKERFLWNYQKFRITLNKIINKFKILDTPPVFKWPNDPGKSCCYEPSYDVKSFYGSLIDSSEAKNSGDNLVLEDIILESYVLNDYYNLFLNSGALDILFITKIIETCNNPTLFGSLDNEDKKIIINKKFLTYCYTGPTTGTPHAFNEISGAVGDENKSCVKCGKSTDEIRASVFSLEDFDKLINEISENTMTNIKMNYNENNPDLSSLKNTCNETCIPLINETTEILVEILGKQNDPEFKKKYQNIFKNIGRLDKVYKPLSIKISNQDREHYKLLFGDDVADKIVKSQLVDIVNQKYTQEAFLLRSYLINYLLKHISNVQNDYNPNNESILTNIIEPDDDISGIGKIMRELQKFKFVSNEYLSDSLFDESVIKIFKKLVLILSVNDIETIIGKMQKYNYANLSNSDEVDNEGDNDVFSPLNSVNLLRFILVKQIYNILEQDNLQKGEVYIIGKFIVALLDKMYYDYELQLTTEQNIKGIIEMGRFMSDKYKYLYHKKKSIDSGVLVQNPLEVMEDAIDDNLEEQQESGELGDEEVDLDHVKEQFIAEWKAEHGDDAVLEDAAIQDYMEQFEYDQAVDAEIDEDKYGLDDVAADAGDYGVIAEDVEDGE